MPLTHAVGITSIYLMLDLSQIAFELMLSNSNQISQNAKYRLFPSDKERIARLEQHVLAIHDAAWVAFADADYEVAIKRFQAVQNYASNIVSVYFGEGICQMEIGSFKRAKQCFYKVIYAKEVKIPQAYAFLSLMAAEEKDLDSAIEQVYKGLEENVDYHPLYAYGAYLNLLKGKFKEAQRDIRDALALSPDDVWYQFQAFLVSMELLDFRSAWIWLEEIAGLLDENLSDTILDISEIRSLQASVDEIIQEWEDLGIEKQKASLREKIRKKEIFYLKTLEEEKASHDQAMKQLAEVTLKRKTYATKEEFERALAERVKRQTTSPIQPGTDITSGNL